MNAPCGQEDCDCGHTIERLRELVEKFLGLNPFGGKEGICISCGGKAVDYPREIHYSNCKWVVIGNDPILREKS